MLHAAILTRVATPCTPFFRSEGQEDQTWMYFVIEGSKTVVLERGGERLGSLSSGDFFGELAALLPPKLKEHRTRTRTNFP
jgi:CRP-like cAMP-binding protein